MLTKNEQLDASRKSKLGDLGIARDNSGTMKTAIGTLEYTAPELHFFGGKVDYGPEIDVYSLGVVCFLFSLVSLNLIYLYDKLKGDMGVFCKRETSLRSQDFK